MAQATAHHPCTRFHGTVMLLALLLLVVTAPRARAGQLVDIGGHRLWIDCEGRGTPTVILEAGLGGLSLEWRQLQKGLSRFTRVCRYDRTGYGRSDYRNMERTVANASGELRRLLERAGIAPPWVLVGHSYGGLIGQHFARNNPGETAALVLLDASHPEQAERFERPPYRLHTVPRGSVSLIRYGAPHLPEGLPPEDREQAMTELTQGKTRYTMGEEMVGFRASEAQVRSSPPLPPVPLVVLTRGRHLWQGPRGELLEGLWLQLQNELAAMSPHSAHLIAADSGHHIHLQQPRLALRGILLAIAASRSSSMRPALAHACRGELRSLRRMRAVDWRSNRLRPRAGILSPYQPVAALPPVLLRVELQPGC